MNFDFREICQKNQITNILVSDSCDLLRSEKEPQICPKFNLIHTQKNLNEIEKYDLGQVDLVWIEGSKSLTNNFEHVMDHILNLGVSWVWINNLRILDYPEYCSNQPSEVDPRTSIPLKGMVQLMEKSMYSIHWSNSMYERSVKNLLLKKF